MSENRGRFSWYELMTTDVDAAIDFYLGIADWGTTVWDEMPDYRMLTVGEAPVAGVMKLPDEAAAHGAPPHWLGYVHTPDIDATAAQAADLGAKPITTFLTITLPMTAPGVLAGSLLVFIPATGEYVIPDLLGGGNVLMIGRVLYNEFNANIDWPVASAVAIALLLLLVLPMTLYQHIQGKENEAS